VSYIAAANVCINGPSLKDILWKSLPPNENNVVHDIGRADHWHNPVGEYKYVEFSYPLMMS